MCALPYSQGASKGWREGWVRYICCWYWWYVFFRGATVCVFHLDVRDANRCPANWLCACRSIQLGPPLPKISGRRVPTARAANFRPSLAQHFVSWFFTARTRLFFLVSFCFYYFYFSFFSHPCIWMFPSFRIVYWRKVKITLAG